MKFTKHRLSDAALIRLSQIVNERASHGHGVALDALVRRGLVERIPGASYPRTHRATDAGREALAEARAAGW